MIRGRRRMLAAIMVPAVAALALLALLGGGAPGAAGVTGSPELVGQTDDSVPVTQITLFGASPGEAAGEIWGIAPRSGSSVLVRYSQSGGWAFGPELQNAAGEPLGSFHLDTPEAFRHSTPSPLAGQMTADGAGAMLGTVGPLATGQQAVLVRNPGGSFKQAPVPEGAEGLGKGESLFGDNSPPLIAALEEPSGEAGALVVPSGLSGVDEAVLHWNGSGWTRETIEVPATSLNRFEVLAISASSPSDAWLLARLEGESRQLALFRRHTGGGTPTWQPVTLKPGGEAGEPLELAGETLDEPGDAQSQLLTATSSGLWIDGQLHRSRASTTLFFVPDGEADSGTVTGSWCKAVAGAPVALCEEEKDEHTLPEALPTDYSRSFAWPGSGGEGQRVVTGLSDGQLLRFGGTSFSLENSLGGEAGGEYGAAFAGYSEGWLGKEKLPVHMTSPANALPSRLQPWPVPFRYALSALAPEPGVAVGAETSEALAVGDNGEVARYHPGEGWFPETLPGPGGSRQTPRLRAVAWPTTMRAFAVGDSKQGAGEMWLWRGETGLWEKDPATPLNFRGNLLGIAFDPDEPSRGYAVGQQGVLLSYGKSWTQEPEEAIPADARGANFTSVAFAGNEAIVAWRKLIHIGSDAYTGGIIVNSGSGWHEDEGAAAVLGTKATPWAVAALPDGGAAFTARATDEAFVYERERAGAPWQAHLYPGGEAPGVLALFRENGALRAVGTGAEPETYTAEEESPPPPGFPAILVNPYPLISEPDRGVLRQTAAGWSDEEHELNDALEPPGGYTYWDTPKVPDPVSALLINETGTQGWAAGGNVDTKRPLLDTADIERYPSEGKKPPGVASSPETKQPGYAAIAVGGGAGCAAPCATRAQTDIGPDVWLKSAVKEAGEIGVSSFLYTGPGVTNGAVAGPPLIPVPWQKEENYYAERTFGVSPLVCTAPAPTDREGSGEGSEAFFEEAFKGYELALASSTQPCKQAQQGASYAFEPLASGVRVIVLDTSEVRAAQRVVSPEEILWLEGQLKDAQGHSIVVANADLPLEYSEGRAGARELVHTIEAGDAAAYFFDAPEQNVKETLTGAEGSTPAYGSGTLGYVNVGDEEQGGFIGQSGFLLAEIANARKLVENPKTHKRELEPRYQVIVKLIPNIEELAVEAQQGTLLRRSQVASFAGLARRPRSGNRSHNQSLDREPETAPYIAIPDDCLGADCEQGLAPEYSFKSSNTEYGEFVKRDIHSTELNAVERNANGARISQESEGGKDGLFCALNATPPNEPVMVTLKVANLSYSLPVTIEAGSVRQPCGTTVLKKKTVSSETETPTPHPNVEPGTSPASSPPVSLPPVPLTVTPVTPAVHVPAPLAQFLPPVAQVGFLPSFLPPPLPTPARPTPPSGTSAVTSPVEAAQKEDEEEAAPESVDAAASAYYPSEHETPPYYLIGLALLAAFAGASLRGRRGPRRGPKVAPATVTSARMQQRWEREEQHRRRRRP